MVTGFSSPTGLAIGSTRLAVCLRTRSILLRRPCRPCWHVMADPQTGAPIQGFSQRYLLSYYYGTPDVNAAPLIVAIGDDLSAGMTFEQEAHTPAMTFGQSGQTLSWQTQGQVARGQSGMVIIDARYDNPQPGDVYTNMASLHAGGYSLPAQAETQIPVFAPLVATPGSGELCPGDVQVRGAIQPGLTVLLKIDGVQVLQTQADAAGNFSATYSYAGSATETLTAQACTAGGACSAASSPATLRPPQSFFCPQRSSWEGTPAVGPTGWPASGLWLPQQHGRVLQSELAHPRRLRLLEHDAAPVACNCPPASGTTAAPTSVWMIADGVRYDPTAEPS